MADWQVKTPVAFIIFRRPDTTERVFETIRQAKPPKLLVVADGPRPGKPGEAEQCAAARAIVDRVDWDCEVLKNFSDTNLGCKRRVSSGLDWVFETVEEAIIIEDDCLPHPTFFRFCEELLQKYRDDERIMAIAGTNRLGKWKSDTQSYHFANYGGIWGWASWRRAWRYYDVDMKLWADPEIKQRVRDVLADDYQFKLRSKIFEATYAGQIDTWDYQWKFAMHIQSGVNIIPAVNLVSNIGFGGGATHTFAAKSESAEIPTYAIDFPLKENPFVALDRDYDREFFKKVLDEPNLPTRAIRKLKKLQKTITAKLK